MSIHDSIPTFETYEEAIENWDPAMKWDVFDGSKGEFNIATECVERHPGEDVALRVQHNDGQREIETFEALQHLSSQFAHAFEEEGIERGARIAILLEPQLDFYGALFGTLKCGCIAVPLSPLFGPSSIRYHVNDSDADLLVTRLEHKSAIPDGLEVNKLVINTEDRSIRDYQTEYEMVLTAGSDPALLQYTSGTTGTPTGHMMKHKSISNMVEHIKFGIGLRESDRFFCELKPTWAGGIWIGTFGPLAFGNAIGSYSGRFSPETHLNGLETFRITNWASTPTALRKVLNSVAFSDYDLALSRISAGGEKLDTNTIDQYDEELGIMIANIYGMSEFGAIIMNFNGFESWEHKPGSIGKPKPGIEVAIIDDEGSKLPPGTIGEIAVRHKEKWFRTNDMGLVDEDGYYWHEGRKDDVILTAGYRVDPFEVEDCLLQHENVREAAVIGVPDDERGSLIKAFVRVDGKGTDQLADDIAQFVKSSLSSHKYPRTIEFVDEFPRTRSGKIRRDALSSDTQ